MPTVHLFSFLLFVFTSKFVYALPSNISFSNDSEWVKAVRKGATLFQQLQSGCYPDKQGPSVNDLLASRWSFAGWPPMAEPLPIFTRSTAQRFQWTTGRDYFRVDADSNGS